jgi:hypothetical protein
MTRPGRPASVFAPAVLLLLAGAASAQPSFVARTDRIVSGLGNPVAVATGDFVNPGDGLLDLAVTWDREDALGILQNNGDGTFSLAVRRDVPPPPSMGGPPESESNVGVNPAGVVAIDLDGDTIRDDVAGVNQESNRFFAYENGGGTWLPADPDASRGGGLSVTVGDWSSGVLPVDACDDLFSATQNGAVNIAVSRCDGSGEFEIVARFFRSGEVSVQTDVEVGDFVALGGGDDGQVDVLTLDNLNQQIVTWPGDPTLDVNLLVEDGLGNTLLVFKPVEVGGQPLTPVQSVAEDWDADGFLDLLVLVEEGHVLWYAGYRDPAQGGFDAPVVVDVAGPLSAGGRMPTRLTAMDYADVVGVNGASAPDGIRDLVLADAGQAGGSDEGFNWLWIVPGTGPAVGMPGMPTFDTALQYHFAAPNLGVLKPGSVVAADFGAGVPDVLLLGFDSSNYTVFRSDGVGGFDAAPSFSAGVLRPRGLASRKLNGADPADVVFVARTDGGIAVLEGDDSGALAEPSASATPAALALGDEVKVARFDGDAVPDALVTFRDEHVLYRGVADGTYTAPEVLADGPESLTGVSREGELGGGAALDLAIYDPALGSPRLEVWRGNGDGTFARAQELPGVNAYSTHAVGRFVPGSVDSIVVAGERDPFASPPQLSLYTDDGSGSYSLSGTASFPPPFDVIPSPVLLMIVGDYDQSGNDDVLAVTGGGEAFLFLSDGTQLVTPPDFFSVGSAPRDGIAADLDLDGRVDVAVANRSSIAVLVNQGGSLAAPLFLPSNIDNASLTAIDLTADLLPEIVASSERTNDVTVFVNQSVPPEPPWVLRVGPDPTGAATRVSWPAVDMATFAVVRGDLGPVWSDATTPLLTVTETPCAETMTVAEFWDDTAPLPPASGLYPPLAFYLARCQDGPDCPDLTFGADSMGVARYANDPPDPCP